MDKLWKIVEEALEIERSNKSNLEKMTGLFELQKIASAETWSEDKRYRELANDVYNFVQTKWNLIYRESDEKTQKEMDKVINNV
jgi:hypothetical protein